MSKNKLLCATALLSLGMGVFALSGSARAELIYATSINTDQVFTVDTTTHVLTPIFNAGVPLDSLFFDPSGRLIYSELDNGTVSALNVTTLSHVTLATGLTAPIDMALEPSLTSFLVSDSTANLVRISLSGSGVINHLSLGLRPDGVIYDNTGRLFVNVSTGFTANNSQVWQINPTTGAVIQSTGNLGVFLDGLTFDPSTGKLFASDYNNGRIFEFDPNNLSASPTIITPMISGNDALSQPDGIDADGNGNLFIASRNNGEVVEYSLGTTTTTDLAFISGLDDLAPVAGLGSLNTVPEPASLPLLAAGLAAAAWLRRKRV